MPEMQKNYLRPTPDQTFEIEAAGDYDFQQILSRARQMQEAGKVAEACNERFKACQCLQALLPDGEEVILEWSHRNTRAALQVLHASAVDHFLIDDFEMSAALLELLLELDPEDHEEAVVMLAFDYVALDEQELFDEVVNDISDKYASRTVLLLWSAFRRDGRLPEGELRRFRSRFTPWFVEFTATEHPADEVYLRDIEGEHPSHEAQARELWLQTENLWRRWPEFIDALQARVNG